LTESTVYNSRTHKLFEGEKGPLRRLRILAPLTSSAHTQVRSILVIELNELEVVVLRSDPHLECKNACVDLYLACKPIRLVWFNVVM
jgi:hypothetical protein